MEFNYTGDKPLFQQVADQISLGILNGAFPEGSQIPSTTEISKVYQINPATVLKGMNLLVDQNLIEKKRGIGMFVLNDAKEKVTKMRKEDFLTNDVNQLIAEAKKLNIGLEELKIILERGYQS